MDFYHIEIDNFISNSNYHQKTKDRYRAILLDFGQFLSVSIQEPFESIHLDRIYVYVNSKYGIMRYDRIDSKLIDNYLLINIEKGYSKLNLCKSALSSFFKYLLKNYDFDNPIRYIDIKISDYKDKNNPTRILSRHQIIKLLQSIINYSTNLKRDLLLVTLLLSTGCRISELLNIEVENINFSDECFFLKSTKNKKDHVVFLRKGFGEVIKNYCLQNKLTAKDILFQHMDRNQVRNLLDFYLDKSNLPKVKIHSFRHSFATLMSESGSPITSIMQLINHSNLSSTSTYIKSNYTRNQNVKVSHNDLLYKKLNDMNLI